MTELSPDDVTVSTEHPEDPDNAGAFAQVLVNPFKTGERQFIPFYITMPPGATKKIEVTYFLAKQYETRRFAGSFFRVLKVAVLTPVSNGEAIFQPTAIETAASLGKNILCFGEELNFEGSFPTRYLKTQDMTTFMQV